jgi:hypothetical protein
MILMALFSTALAMPLARLALARTSSARTQIGDPIAPFPGQRI